MALKDRMNKIISYFETDDGNELEEAKLSVPSEEFKAKELPSTEKNNVPFQRQRVQQDSLQRVSASVRATSNEEGLRSMQVRQEQISNNQMNQENVTIAIKYPKKYEDATEIVDLLIANECVLIDFQFMLDAQARRCLDFIDGASRVLYGNLQKVSSSMYLLTPSNVVVEAEDINFSHNNNQDFNFDYDMKRR